MAEPEDDEEEEGQKGEKRSASAAQPSLTSLIISVLALTLVAVGGGSFLGLEFADRLARAAGNKPKADEAKGVKPPVEGAAEIVTLAPIITNLGAPKGTWVRLEAAIVVEGVMSFERDALVAKIAEDTVAFLRTVPLAQIEGATGFQNLREDLNDRVRVRSEGKARELLIQTLIVE